ncbi:MAG: hypothetical protein JXB47_09350 [Anaerolineae bacterium]|nr:hypothetical protein [Anaerolineae bacterium]
MNTMTAVMIGLVVVVGLAGGHFVERKSKELAPVRGGQFAALCHRVVCMVMAALPAAFWFALVVSLHPDYNLFEDFVKIALAGLAVMLAALLGYAVAEPDAAAPKTDKTQLPLD